MTLPHRSAPATYTLGQIASRVGLARTSVLHYESLGLLQPRARTDAGYRHYGEAELERLRRIRDLREAGLALADIRVLLAPSDIGGPQGDAQPADLLERRMMGLNQEVERLRTQQRQLAQLLAMPDFRGRGRRWDKAGWVALLRGAGFDDEAMHRWHVEFERESPQAHERFLQSLGLPAAQIQEIRRASAA